MSLGLRSSVRARLRVASVADVVFNPFDRGQTNGSALGLAAADAVAGIDADRFAISEKRAQVVELARSAAAVNAGGGHGKVKQKACAAGW